MDTFATILATPFVFLLGLLFGVLYAIGLIVYAIIKLICMPFEMLHILWFGEEKDNESNIY